MARAATVASKTASGTAAIGPAVPAAALRGRALTDAEAGRPLLDVRGVTMQYKTQAHLITATYRVSFSVLQGDRFVVVGPSGCGKSTLLKAVGGYLAPTEGEIRLKGELIAKPGPDRIMVFQEFDQLLPWKTVFENVVFPLKTTGFNPSLVRNEPFLSSIRSTKAAEIRRQGHRPRCSPSSPSRPRRSGR